MLLDSGKSALVMHRRSRPQDDLQLGLPFSFLDVGRKAGEGQLLTGSLPVDELPLGNGSGKPDGSQKTNRFQQIAFPLRIGSLEHRDVRREIELQSNVIAEIG